VAVMQSVLTALGSFDVQAQATIAGTHIPLSNWLVVIVAAVPAVALLRAGPAVRSMRRGYLALVLTTGLTVAGFALYQHVSGGANSYYLPKMVCGGYVLALPALWLLALLMRRVSPQVQLPPRALHRAGAAFPTAGFAAVSVLVTGALIGLGLAQQWLPGTEIRGRAAHFVPLARWSDGKQKDALAPTFEALAKAGLMDGRTPTIVVASGNVSLNAGVTFVMSGLNNCLGRMDPVMKAMGMPVHSASGAVLTGQPVKTVLAAIRVAGGSMRVVAPSAAYASRLRAAVAADPRLHVTVVVVAMGLPYTGAI
jgi:hypothetical protein